MKKNKFYYLTFVITFSVLTSSCSFNKSEINTMDSPQSREIANSDLDNLNAEFKALYDFRPSTKRKNEIKVFQENILKYLIDATNSSDEKKILVYKEANNYFNKVYPLLLENFKNEKIGKKVFNEIKTAPLWTLRDELDYLNKAILDLPEPKIKIDLIAGLEILSEFYKHFDKIDKVKLGNRIQSTMQKVLGKDFNLHPKISELENILEANLTEDNRILRVVKLIDSKINRHELRIRNIGSEIAKNGHVDLNNPQIKVIVTFIDYYFKKLPNEVIKTIMSELVTAGAKLPEEEVMKIIFQNTGPGLGKVLQQIGKEKGIGPEFEKLTTILESSGKEVPYHLIEKVVKNDKGGFEVSYIENRPVGTGTIAQVNRAKIWVNGKEVEVALRFLKPGVEIRCKEDIQTLRQFVPDNEKLFAEGGIEDLKVMSTLIDGIENFLNEEVDIDVAVKRQKEAYEVYNRSIKVTTGSKFDMIEMMVPEVFQAPKGKSNLHVQEFAAGGAKFANIEPAGIKKAVANEMVRMWFEEALFRSGFLNADLHQGNFRVVLVEDKNKIKILLYDFGLSSTLSKEEQRAFLLIGAGAYLKSSKTLAEGLMASMNKSDRKFKAKLLKEIELEMKSSPDKLPEDWLVWCVQKNYFVSENLGALARGSLLLKQLPESIGQTEMFKDTIVKAALINLGRSLADRDYNFPLKKIDLIKLGIAQSKSFCLELIRNFFKK